MPPTLLLSCADRRGDDRAERRRRPRGFSLAGQSSSVNSEKRPSPILDHHGTQCSPPRWSKQHNVCCDLPSLCLGERFASFHRVEIFDNNLLLAENMCKRFFLVFFSSSSLFFCSEYYSKTGNWIMAGFKAIHKKNAQFFQLKSSDPFHAWISFSCKPNHWGGTQLGKANERETAERPKGNFERKQRGAKCFKMADVRSQWRMDLGINTYGDVKSCGQNSVQSERGRWNVMKSPMVTLEQQKKTKKLLARRFL